MLAAWARPEYAATDEALRDLRDTRMELTLADVPSVADFADRHKVRRGPTRVAVVVEPERERPGRRLCRVFEVGAPFSPVLFTDYRLAAEWLAGCGEAP